MNIRFEIKQERIAFIIRILLIVLVSVTASSFSVNVLAADSPLEFLKKLISPDNPASKMVCATLGDPMRLGYFGNCENTSAPLLQAIGIFNSLVFGVAGWWFGWNVFSSMVSAAGDGEFLGKSTSNSWYPMRTFTGAALLSPLANGYTVAQAVFMLATAIGIGAGAAGVSGVNHFWPGNITNYTMPQNIPKLSENIDLIKSNASCLANKIITAKQFQNQNEKDVWNENNSSIYINNTDVDLSGNEYGQKSNLVIPDQQLVIWGITQKNNNELTELSFGARKVPDSLKTVHDYSPDVCGSLTIGYVNNVDNNYSKYESIRKLVSDNYKSAIIDLSNNLANAYIEKATKIANEIPADDTKILGILSEANKNFDKLVYERIKNEIDNKNKETIEDDQNFLSAKNGNWMVLGFSGITSFKSRIDQQMSTSLKTTGKLPNPSPNSISTPNVITKAGTGDGITDAQSAVEGMNIIIDKPIGKEVDLDPASPSVIDVIRGSSGGWINHQLSSAVKVHLTIPIARSIKAADSNPVYFIQELAMVAVNSVATIFTLMVGFGIGFGIVFSGAWLTIVAFFVPILLSIFLIGARMLIWIPFLYATHWLGAILNWIIVVCVGFFASPLWAMMHLEKEGDGMGQGTKHGYLFLLTVIFTPILLVASYFLSQSIMQVIWVLFKDSVANNMLAIDGIHSSEWISTVIFDVGVLFVLMVVAESIVSKAGEVPSFMVDKTMQWVSGTYMNLSSGELTGGVKAGVARGGAGSELTNKLGGGTGNMMKNMAGKAKKQEGIAAKAAADKAEKEAADKAAQEEKEEKRKRMNYL